MHVLGFNHEQRRFDRDDFVSPTADVVLDWNLMKIKISDGLLRVKVTESGYIGNILSNSLICTSLP